MLPVKRILGYECPSRCRDHVFDDLLELKMIELVIEQFESNPINYNCMATRKHKRVEPKVINVIYAIKCMM